MANRPAPALGLREGDREELARLTRSSSVRAGLAQRARIVLLAADGVSNTAIAEPVGVSRPTVIGWRDRYAAQGLAGLDDEPRSGRPRTIDHRRVVTATLTPPPKKYGVTHWSTRLLARHLGISRRDGGQGVARVPGPAVAGRDVPVLHRPGAGRQGHRRGRAVPGPAGERGRAVRGREVPDPGAGPDRADPAAAARAGRAPLPRLRPARHLDPVRGVGDRHRQGHRGVQAPAPAPGVPGLPQAGRPRLPRRRHRAAAPGDGQLRRPQAPRRQGLAGGEPSGARATSPRPTPPG